jgi:hypothetical protein
MVMADDYSENDYSEDEPYILYYKNPKSIAAQKLYDEPKNSVFLLLKKTRTGATTSLGIEPVIRHEKDVIITYTHKIAKDTVIDGITTLCKSTKLPEIPNIVHVPSNEECTSFQEDLDEALFNRNIHKKAYEEYIQKVKEGNATADELKEKKDEYWKYENEYTDLKKLKVKPKGEECGYDCLHFDECPCMRVLREEADIIVLTYQKIVNMMRVLRQGKNSNSLNKAILDILREYKNIILDEAHHIDEEPLSVSIDTAERIVAGDFIELLKDKEYPATSNVLRLIYQLFTSDEIRKGIEESQAIAKSKNRTKVQNKIKVERPIKQEQSTKSKNNKLTELTIYGAVLREMYSLIKSHKARKYKLKYNIINDILDYTDLFNEKKYIITTERIDVRLITKIASSRNTMHTYLGDFLRGIQNKGNYRIFINSATPADFNFRKIFKRGTVIKKRKFGAGGDPSNSTEKMKVFLVDFTFRPQSKIKHNLFF